MSINTTNALIIMRVSVSDRGWQLRETLSWRAYGFF